MAKRIPPLAAIAAVVLTDVLGLTLIIPLLPFYAEHYGASAFVVGLLYTCYSAFQLVSGPLLGKWSDRTGRRPLLILSQLGTVASLLLLAHAWALWVVFASRIIDGFTAGNLSLAQAYIADVTVPEKRARAFGIIGIAFGVGFFLGPAMTGLLVPANAHTASQLVVPIYLAAGLSLTSAFLSFTILPSVQPAAAGDRGARKLSILQWGEYKKYFQNPALRGRLFQMGAFLFAFQLFMGGFALFAERRFHTAGGHPYGAKQVGYILMLAGLVGIVQQGGMIGPFVKRFGESKLIRGGFALAALGYALLACSHGVAILIVAVVVSSFGAGFIRPVLTSQVTQHAGPTEYGSILGLTQSMMAGAQILAPPLATFVIGLYDSRGLGLTDTWLWLWALTAAALFAGGLLIPVPHGDHVPVPAQRVA
jgi:MFS family permease